MPNRNGVVMQIFGYSAFSANTTAATEGTPGSGQTLTQNTRSITLSQYADYITLSDKVDKTALTDVLSEGASEIGFRGAITVDTVINTTVDVAANSDSATQINITHGSYMTASKARQAAQSIRSANGKPKDNGLFYGIIHSLVAFDLINDSNTNSVSDLQKYTDTLAANNPARLGVSMANRVAVVGGVEWWESNNVATQTNWQSSSSTAYFNYVFGKDAVFASSLGKTALGQKNFSVSVDRFAQGTQSLDPAGLIAAAASYNFFFGCAVRPGSTNLFRRIACEASIS